MAKQEVDAPLVSVVIPTYNRRALLGETLDSVRAQTYPHWEAVVVDDGSTDDTWAYLDAVSKEEPRIRPFRREGEKKTANTCRNQGFRRSKGVYVVFLDSDDLLMPQCLERRVADLHSRPDLGYVAYLSEVFAETPGDLGVLWNVFTTESDLTRFLRMDSPFAVQGPMWRRGVIEQHPWDEEMLSWQDGDLHRRILASGVPGAGVNEPDNYVRRPPGGQGNISDRSREYAHLVCHLRSYLSIAALLAERDAMTMERGLAIASIVYGQCRWLAMMGRGRDARRYWRRASKMGLPKPVRRVEGCIAFSLWSLPFGGWVADAYLQMRWRSYGIVPRLSTSSRVLLPGREKRSDVGGR